MSNARTVVEILNRSLAKVAEIKALYPLNEQGMVLRYSKELSDYGSCSFRVASDDPIFDQFGDILVPHKYHVRLKRAGVVVWQGAIVDNPRRNKTFIEVKAHEYEYYLDKVLVSRTSESTPGSGYHYRTFSTGTMIAAVQALITESKTAFGADHILYDMAVGDLENPDYPAQFSTASNAPLTGSWNFSSDVTLQFDYHSVLYVLKTFGIYGSCDFRFNNDLTLDFKPFIGDRNNGLTFQYGSRGNIVDYEAPRLGNRMANDITGIAATPDGVILHANKRDEAAVQEYGLLQTVTAYSDVKDKNSLQARLAEELRFLKTPEDSPINVVLNEKAYPLGQFDIGDIVTVSVQDNVIDFKLPRRIVGFTVNLHSTGRELTTIQTNKVKDSDLGV